MFISPEIFRAYDIRGVVDRTLTEDAVFNIGRAIGSKVISLQGNSIVIGRDGRLSGVRLLARLAAGILSTGCAVVDVGEVPTPCLYFASYELKIDSAIMLTGSHNPPDYNGLKIILAGVTIYGAAIQELNEIIQYERFVTGAGEYSKTDIVPAYMQSVTDRLSLDKPLKVVVDCGNGVPAAVAPLLYANLGCEIIPLYCEVDGNFPNHHPDPSEPHNLEAMIKSVKEHQADLGLAFDGDGDRLGIVDNNGKIIWPDRVLMLFAEELLSREPGATIIYDIKCTRDLDEIIKKAGGVPLMWNTGHSLIKAKMRETNALLAAEMSGHMFFKDGWFGFDDAIYTGARLLHLLSKSEDSSTQIFARYPESVSTPELSVAVSEENKFIIMQQLVATVEFAMPHKIITIDGLRVEFADGWGLIRPSNTTPKLVVRFEADSEQVLDRIKSQFRAALLKIDSDLMLPF